MKAVKATVPAYLTVFVSLTLTLVLSLCLVLIEGARQNTVRLEAECIADVGVNSVLAEYHRQILEQYDLFFVDCSYGTELPAYYNTEARLRYYVEKNLDQEEELGILAGNNILPGIYMDLLKIEDVDVKIIGVSLATDNAGYGLQKQAVQVVEQNVGITFLEQVISWIQEIEANGLRENSLEEQAGDLEKELEVLREKKRKEDSWIEVEIHNPSEPIFQIRRTGILNWVLKEEERVSSKSILEEQYIRARREKGEINEGNFVEESKLNLYEQLLFHEYLLQYAGNYLDVKENAALDYQVEYLLFGSGSDTDNLRKTVVALCGLRETANLLYLSGSAEKMQGIKAVASVLSAAILSPEAEPVFEGLLMLGWACLESLQDLKILMRGGQVPLLKDDDSWNCSLENLFDFSFQSNKAENGLGYEDYLRLLLYFAGLEQITFRFMDLMEMDIRKIEGNQNFRMDGCIDYLETKIRISSGYGYEYEVKYAGGYR